MSLGLRWGKLRLDSTTRSLLDRAVADLNRKRDVKFHLIKHPWGKLIACHVDDLWFCHVGDGGRPPRIWTLAVDTRPEQRTLLPDQSGADFDECCDLLGFRTEEQRSQFREWLRPDMDQAETFPIPGAS